MSVRVVLTSSHSKKHERHYMLKYSYISMCKIYPNKIKLFYTALFLTDSALMAGSTCKKLL